MATDDTLDILIRLRGGSAAAAEVRTVEGAVKSLGTSTRSSGDHAMYAQSRWAQLSNTFWTVRNLAYIAGSAMTGFGLGRLAAVGVQFNASMEQLQVGFTHFLGSAKAAHAYLADLYQLAAKTPFEFQPLTQAAEQMLAFGFSADEALTTLRSIGDAVSGLGTGQEGINRIVLALGQIKSAGTVRGQELLQLQQAGINANKYLEAAGLMTQADVGNVANLHIGATQAIAAIVAGMNREFGGLSAAQAKTFTGQLSTARDYARQFLGVLTHPGFDWLRTKVLPGLNKDLTLLTNTMKQGGDVVPVIDRILGAGGRLTDLFDTLASIGRNAWGVIHDLWPVLHALAMLLGGLLLDGLHVVNHALGLLEGHATTLQGLVVALTAAFVAYRGVLITVAVAQRIVASAQMLWFVVTLIAEVTSLADAFALLVMVVGGTVAAVAAIVAAVVVVIALLVFLELRFHIFSRAGAAAWGWIKQAGIDAAHGISAAWQWLGRALSNVWGGVKEGFRAALNWIIRRWNNFHVKFGGVKVAGHTVVPGFDIRTPNLPLLAAGGVVQGAGAAIVGDRGPELLQLPEGARVSPLDQRSAADLLPEQRIIMQVDGRTLAETVVRHGQIAAGRA